MIAPSRRAARSGAIELARILAIALLLVLAPPALCAQATPVGRWQATSDGKPSALIDIREADGQLVGTIVALFSASDSAALCDQCDGNRRDQRVLGMEMLWGMHPDGDGWSGGSILDPESGKIYRATMHLEDDGRRLVVRGYVGFSLFGRSEVWVRMRM